MIQVQPVILCGGSGTRLWPLSRAGFPKQFLVLSGTTSLFQQAIERVNDLSAHDIAVWSYNHDRPNMALGGFTPKQRLAMAA